MFLLQLDLDRDAPSLYARGPGSTRYTPTFSRPATSTAISGRGNTVTYLNHQPALEWWDWDGDTVRETPGLYLKSAGPDALSYAWNRRPAACTIYVRGIPKNVAAGDHGLFDLGGNNATPRFIGYISTNQPTILHHNGVSSVSRTRPVVAVDDECEFRAVLRADGSLLFGSAVNGAAETVSAASAALTLAGAWATATFYVNRYSAVTVGDFIYLNIRIAEGERTLAEMRPVRP